MRLSSRVFDMEFLLQRLTLSGSLRSADMLATAVRTSIYFFTSERRLREYFLGLVDSLHALPGRWAIYRHMLTVHMATCLRQQSMLDNSMECSGGGGSLWHYGRVATGWHGNAHDRLHDSALRPVARLV